MIEHQSSCPVQCLSVNLVEAPDNLSSLKRGGSVCEEQRESSIESFWFPVLYMSSFLIPEMISFFLPLRIYIAVLDFIISMISYLHFSQNDHIYIL